MATFTLISGVAMTISDGTTSQQTMTMFGVDGPITDVSVSLFGLTHTYSGDIDMLLRGPNGSNNLLFWSDVGSDNDYSSASFAISDGAASQLSAAAANAPGSYKPTNFDNNEAATNFGNPAGGINPAGPEGTGTFASAFGGTSANGGWTLFVADDAGGDTGSLAQWGVTVSTAGTTAVIEGTEGGDTISITFTGLDQGFYFLNGSGVQFSGVTSFTVNGNGGDDTLTVNQGSAQIDQLTFNGGANGTSAGDRLVINGGWPMTGHTVNLTGAGEGNLDFDELGPANFTGTETVVSGMTMGNLNVNLPGSADTVFLEDDGSIGNNTSQIRSGNGTFSTLVFLHPNTSLNIASGAGDTVNVDLTDALNGNFTIGSAVDGAVTPDRIAVQNVEASGSVALNALLDIKELGDDPDADVTANTLALKSATSWIGSNLGTGNALETHVSIIEAAANNGIALHNLRSVYIGNITADLSGLSNSGPGDIRFRADGDINLEDSTGGFVVTNGTSGSVRIDAVGYGSSVLGFGQQAIEAPGGSIVVTAGEDIDLGLESGNSDLRANGSVTLQAGRDVFLRSDADARADDYGNNTGGALSITAGRDIWLQATADVTTRGGDITLTTGPGGLLTTAFNYGVNGGSIFTYFGDVFLNADRMDLGATGPYSVIASANANLTDITLKPVTAGRAIRLGSVTDLALALELSDAELDRLSSPNIFIGSNGAGSITVQSAVTPSDTFASNLTLRTGGSISIFNALGTAGALNLFAGANIAVSAAGSLTAASVTAKVDTPNTDAGTGGSFTHASTLTPAMALTGATDADTLVGGNGGDTINGAAGADRMEGGLGDDVYYIDSHGDVVVETGGLGGGADTVNSTFTTTLGADVENLTLIGSANADGTGNAAANRITGNTGNNALFGMAGNDTLIGGDGDDELRGQQDADSMIGGLGNDRYFVDHLSDVVDEATAGPTGGIDTVFSSLSYTLGANLENLRLQTSNPLDGTGNELNNKIYGTAGANTLKGLVGNDTIEGRDGADTIEGGEGNDTLSGGSQADVFRFATSNTGVDRILDFNKNADRFDLSGGTFTALTTAANGDAVLTHAGGSIRIATPPNLTLAQWNALVLPSGGRVASDGVPAARGDTSDTVALFGAEYGHDIGAPAHGDWAFA